VSRVSEGGASPRSTAGPNTKQIKLKLRVDSMEAIKMKKVKLKSISRGEPRNSIGHEPRNSIGHELRNSLTQL
jgi:hypothetical protein